MASAALYLRTNSSNPVYTEVPYKGIGKYSDCLLLLFLRCCTSPHLLRLRPLMCGTRKLSVQLHSFWLFAQLDCSRSHIDHPTDNSSASRGGFGHRPPLSQACFRQLDEGYPASFRTDPIQVVPKLFFVVFVLRDPNPSVCAPDRRVYCNTAVRFLQEATVLLLLHLED